MRLKEDKSVWFEIAVKRTLRVRKRGDQHIVYTNHHRKGVKVEQFKDKELISFVKIYPKITEISTFVDLFFAIKFLNFYFIYFFMCFVVVVFVDFWFAHLPLIGCYCYLRLWKEIFACVSLLCRVCSLCRLIFSLLFFFFFFLYVYCCPIKKHFINGEMMICFNSKKPK